MKQNRQIALVLILALLVPMIPIAGNIAIESRPTFLMAEEEGQVIWHNDCSNTTGWVRQDSETDFQLPEYFNHDTNARVSSSSGFVFFDNYSSPFAEYQGVLYTQQLDAPILFPNLISFETDMEFHDIGQSGRIEYLAINLFDENKQLMFLFYIHDGWTAPDHFGTRISYYESGDSETSWIDRYSDWRGILRIGLDQDSGAILCSQGSAPETTLIEAGMFNVSRVITYIGIYGLRRDGYLPNDDRMRIHDIIANYSIEQTTTTTSTTTSTATTPTTTSSSPTSPTIPTESDVMVFVIIGVGGGALAVIAIVIVLLRRNPAGGSSQEPYSW